MDDPDPWDALDDEADSVEEILEEARGQSTLRFSIWHWCFDPVIDPGML